MPPLLKRTYETAETPYTFFVFSWPSDGSLMPYIAYANDRADARTSGAALGRGLLKLGEFVRRVSDELGPRVRSDLGRDAETARRREELCAGRLHLMAHSMGAYALRHAVQGMRREIGDDLPRLFDEILLIAADEDADAFEHDHKLALLPRLGTPRHGLPQPRGHPAGDQRFDQGESGQARRGWADPSAPAAGKSYCRRLYGGCKWLSGTSVS